MKDRILNTLDQLRRYALSKGYSVSIYFQEEDSSLMRFANSAISLNTNEHLIRLNITACDGRKRASYGMITDLFQGRRYAKRVETAAEMVKHSMLLTYELNDPRFPRSVYRRDAGTTRPAEIATLRNWLSSTASYADMESDEIKLSGVFLMARTPPPWSAPPLRTSYIKTPPTRR